MTIINDPIPIVPAIILLLQIGNGTRGRPGRGEGCA